MSAVNTEAKKEVSAFLEKHINGSKLSQKEIASICGFKNYNVVSMIKRGETGVPVEKIPKMAQALDLDRAELFEFVMSRYRPGELKAIKEVYGSPITEAERQVIKLLREIIPEGHLTSNPQHFISKIREALTD